MAAFAWKQFDWTAAETVAAMLEETNTERHPATAPWQPAEMHEEELPGAHSVTYAVTDYRSHAATGAELELGPTYQELGDQFDCLGYLLLPVAS